MTSPQPVSNTPPGSSSDNNNNTNNDGMARGDSPSIRFHLPPSPRERVVRSPSPIAQPMSRPWLQQQQQQQQSTTPNAPRSTMRPGELQDPIFRWDPERPSSPAVCSTPDYIQDFADLPVYINIHRIRTAIESVVEDYLSYDQLRDVRINIAVVRPLIDKLYGLEDISIVYCLMVNRARFLDLQTKSSNRQNVNFARATLCEMVATRILRRWGEDNPGDEGLLTLANILVGGFEPFQGAPDEVLRQAHRCSSWSYAQTLPALEVAILSDSKMFLASTTCQKVVDGIYEGRIIYTPSSYLSLIPDHYKQLPIALYNPRQAPFLNHYRLVVPKYRNALELVQFCVLLVLYLSFMAERDASHYSLLELCFSVYSFSWVLDNVATILAHGWHVYTQNLWSFLDVTFAVVYWLYLLMRINAWYAESIELSQQALDILVMAAPVLIPRLAFNLLSDNLLVLALRSLMADFTMLTFLTIWCFAGFFVSMYWLGEGIYSSGSIAKWMLWIWFGLDGTGITKSTEFHEVLGPMLMVMFAFLGNTLFLTILVSMLANTFSKIESNATEEVRFRRAVVTLEGVKSDAIFAYQPPFNLLAVFVLLPLKFLVSPRWFHKIHVGTVRLINMPLLLLIAVLERKIWQFPDDSLDNTNPTFGAGVDAGYGTTNAVPAPSQQRDASSTSSPLLGATVSPPVPAQPARPRWLRRRLRRLLGWRITTHGDLETVFEIKPPDSVQDQIHRDDHMTRHLIRRQFARPPAVAVANTALAGPSATSASGLAQPNTDMPHLQMQPSQQQPSQTLRQHAASASGSSLLTSAPSSLTYAAPTIAAAAPPGAPSRPKLRTANSRRDSMFPQLAEQIRGTMTSEGDSGAAVAAANAAAAGTAELGERLSKLETQMGRMEDLLRQLCSSRRESESAGDKVGGSSGGGVGSTK